MVEQDFTALPTMKNPLDYIQKYSRRTKRVLGINYSQLQQRLGRAELKQAQQQAERERQKVRVNTPGGERKPILSIAEQVCLCLFYLRHCPTFEILGLQSHRFSNHRQGLPFNFADHTEVE